MQSTISKYVPTALGLIAIPSVVIMLWQALSAEVSAVPTPLQTFDALLLVANRGQLGSAAWATTCNSLAAFIAATVIGTIIGGALGRSPFGYRVFEPIIVVSAAVPKIILYPILLLLLGIGAQSVIAMGFIGGVFPVLINVMAAVRDMKPVYAMVGRTLGVGPLRSFCRIYLPAIRPSLLAAVRLSFGLTLVNVVIAELFASRAGVGKLISTYYGIGEFSEMLALILLFFVVSTGGAVILWGIERRVQSEA